MATVNLCKKVFGVTFHAHMSVEDIVGLWRGVDPNIRANYPDLNTAMEAAGVAYEALVASRAVMEGLALAKRISEDGVMAGAAAATANVAYPAAKIALEAGKQALAQFQDQLVLKLNDALNKVNLGCNGQ